MNILQNMTIKYKLLTIVMFACLSGLILAGAAFVGWNQNMLRGRLVESLSTRAQMVAENCKVSLAFQDDKDAAQVLEALYVDSHIVFGGVYNEKNVLFAGYYRNDDELKKLPTDIKSKFYFGRDMLTVNCPIILDNRPIGTVCLQSDLDSISTALKHGIGTIILVIAAAMLVVFLISIRLQEVISNPILGLTHLANTVSEKKDYSVRATKQSDDEVGQLIESFNEMLGQIEQRDSELLEAKESLEVKVHQRTAEITKTNEKLVNEICERQKAEEEIRHSQQILQTMIDAMPFGVLVIGKDKIIQRANNAVMKMTGFSKEELVGNLCHCTLCPAEKNKCPIIDCGQALDSAERKLITKHGQEMPIIKTAVPMKIGNEDVLLEAFVDITERKEDEEKVKRLNFELANSMAKLKEANEEMKSFVYVASHDLREPLRKITAFGSILEKSLKDKLDSDDSENLKFMIDGATRMNMMIEGLLVYSRVSTKSLPPQVVDLNEIVTQLQQLELSVVLQEKKAVVEVPVSLPCVDADPVQIRQLLQNLIANGIKYQPKDSTPKITIACKPAADGMVRIEVTDNGIGIKAEYLTAIFAMFKRLHTRTEYEGTGIGLAVCKKIAERHGGQIGVESEYGKGSTFWFTAPAVGNNVELVAESKNAVETEDND
jgi:PAS domain S-box-containing protein